jgi:hypothetical protein
MCNSISQAVSSGMPSSIQTPSIGNLIGASSLKNQVNPRWAVLENGFAKLTKQGNLLWSLSNLVSDDGPALIDDGF